KPEHEPYRAAGRDARPLPRGRASARLPNVPTGIGLPVAYQAVQIALASLTVAAYAALQLGLTRPSDRRYLLMNLLGAGGLLVIAVRSFELGFVITNGWAEPGGALGR